MTDIRAAEDRVLVRLSPKQRISAGGIIIPDSAQKNSITGTVVSVGPKVREDIRKRDIAIFGEYAGAVVREEGKDNPTPLVALVEGEILAVHREEDFFEEDEDPEEIRKVLTTGQTFTTGQTYTANVNNFGCQCSDCACCCGCP